MQIDLRKFTRHSFSLPEKINAFCQYSLDDKLIPFHVANISKGGIRLIANKNIIKTITIRDILILNHISGNRHLEFMKNIKLKVRWVLNSKNIENIGIGCGYIVISDSVREQINDFIEAHSNKL